MPSLLVVDDEPVNVQVLINHLAPRNYRIARAMSGPEALEMIEKGFLASTLYYAMYAHTEEHVRAYLNAVNEVFAEVSSSLKNDRIMAELQGLPARSGFKRLT